MSDDFALTPPKLAAVNPKTGKETRGETWRRRAAVRLSKMHQRYGRIDGQTCKTCAFLERHGRARHKSWLKCRKSTVSMSDATDWRAGWTRCGAYEEAK